MYSRPQNAGRKFKKYTTASDSRKNHLNFPMSWVTPFVHAYTKTVPLLQFFLLSLAIKCD